jgi:integrase
VRETLLESTHQASILSSRAPARVRETLPRQTHFKYRDRSFMETVNEYLEWGQLQGGRKGRPWSQEHASRKKRHLCLWAETLDLKVLADLDNVLPRVEATLRELAERDRSGKTLSNISESLVSFCNWAVMRGFLAQNPLAKLGKLDTTPQETYRALTPDEIYALLNAAPEHLRLLYAVAMVTGLRAGELRSLTRKHLDTVNDGLRLDAAWTKNRKPGFQPLPQRMVRELESFCNSGIVPYLYQQYFRKLTCPRDALLYVPSHPARELDKVLKAAGIPKRTAEGKVAFHGLRTSFVTLAYEAGATHREAQELARHSTPGLTANRYGRTRNERLAGITERSAETVLSGQIGANLVHETKLDITAQVGKFLPGQLLTAVSAQWRRGDSNPRPEMFQDKPLHA